MKFKKYIIKCLVGFILIIPLLAFGTNLFAIKFSVPHSYGVAYILKDNKLAGKIDIPEYKNSRYLTEADFSDNNTLTLELQGINFCGDFTANLGVIQLTLNADKSITIKSLEANCVAVMKKPWFSSNILKIYPSRMSPE